MYQAFLWPCGWSSRPSFGKTDTTRILRKAVATTAAGIPHLDIKRRLISVSADSQHTFPSRQVASVAVPHSASTASPVIQGSCSTEVSTKEHR